MAGGSNTPVRSVLYFVNWAIYARAHNPQDLPLDNVSHVLYAFANIRPETGTVYLTDSWADTDKHYPGDSWNDGGGTNLYGCLKQLFLLKKRNRRLKVLLSVGGWTYSANFATPAASQAGRAEFARSVAEIVRDCGFDGVDIDWEYPRNAAEAEDYVRLLEETRKTLDSSGAGSGSGGSSRFLLTVACPAGTEHFSRLRVAEMDRHLDFWNLMAYDYAGGWDQRAGHQSNLYPSVKNPQATPFNTEAALNFYTGHGGVHPSKMVLGMPLYGRAFTNTDGPGQPFVGTGEGSWENGVWDYKALPKDDAVEYHDCEGKQACCASWSYSDGTRTMISYDTPTMVDVKARFVRDRGMGGGMWWESSADKQGDGSLVSTFVRAMGGKGSLDQTMNCLHYPHSKYDNLRKGFPGEG